MLEHSVSVSQGHNAFDPALLMNEPLRKLRVKRFVVRVLNE